MTAAFAVILLCSFLYRETAPEQNSGLSDVAHVFPVTPDDPEWATMSHFDRHRACYVSREELSQMTTRALVETILNYPFLINIYLIDDPSQGLTPASSTYVGFEELRTRDDAVEVVKQFQRKRAEEKIEWDITDIYLSTLLEVAEQA